MNDNEEFPAFVYTLLLDDGETEINEVGYLILNSVFVGIAKGSDGIMQQAYPIKRFYSAINHGPVNAATTN